LITVQPLEGKAFAVVGALALFGLPTAVATQSSGLAALVTFLAVLAVLLVIAGFKLQREHDRRLRPAFTIEQRIEKLSGDLKRRGVGTFHERMAFWVRVKNLGPDADFVARVENVTGGRHAASRKALEDGYSVDRVAWIDTTSGRMPISRGEVGTLRLAEWAIPRATGIPESPVAYFFEAATAAHSPDGHGAGWLLDASLGCPPIDFDLTVSNVTADTQATLRLSIGYDPGMHFTFNVVA
jgi:hypothetical protein